MNQENKKQVIIAGALGVVLVAVLVYQFLIAGGPAPPPKAAGGNAQASAKAAPEGGKGAAPKGGAKADDKVASAEGPTRLKKVDVDLDALLQNINVVTFVYDNEKINRNPMTPLVGRVIAPTTMDEKDNQMVSPGIIRSKSVSGIIYNEFNPVAIVDDEVITEGYQYPDGVVVTQIEPKRVWFQWRDTLIPVELKEL
ncbi:MAG: hypothetical protein JNK74_09630 [Candidatus Hydrogenedentes bacterium]|nr:hypothetical protein [Candidatus Hydrogenedentota bacterium]